MVIVTEAINATLEAYFTARIYDRIFVLTDAHTHRYCLPRIARQLAARGAETIVIEAGDMAKDIRQVGAVWQALSAGGASRRSLLINVGGGMVSDLGGFAAATFKRGIHTLNIPTTLMAAVDAAIGGKTGINFNGLKNEIGAFYSPDCVIIDTCFLQTLDADNFFSGYAEMLKHGLISDRETLDSVLAFDVEHPNDDRARLTQLIRASVAIKERIVEQDPEEAGIRKALNFGHTVGHAIESLCHRHRHEVLHGHAVAAGLVCELYLSHKICGLPTDLLRLVTNFVRHYYRPIPIGCNDYDGLYERMTHDKKNVGGHILFTLLADVGEVRINQEIDRDVVFASIDFYRENTGMA